MTQNSSPTDEKNSSAKPGRRKALVMTPAPLSKAQLIEQGSQAQSLLQSTVYNVAYQSCLRQLQDEWVEQADAQVRERIWHQIQAMGLVQQRLAEFVVEARALTEEALREEESNVIALRESQGFA